MISIPYQYRPVSNLMIPVFSIRVIASVLPWLQRAAFSIVPIGLRIFSHMATVLLQVVDFTILIGADGVHSRVRQSMFSMHVMNIATRSPSGNQALKPLRLCGVDGDVTTAAVVERHSLAYREFVLDKVGKHKTLQSKLRR